MFIPFLFQLFSETILSASLLTWILVICFLITPHVIPTTLRIMFEMFSTILVTCALLYPPSLATVTFLWFPLLHDTYLTHSSKCVLARSCPCTFCDPQVCLLCSSGTYHLLCYSSYHTVLGFTHLTPDCKFRASVIETGTWWMFNTCVQWTDTWKIKCEQGVLWFEDH